MKPHALLLVLVLVLAPPALAQTTITIDRCYDGDTCTSTDGKKIRPSNNAEVLTPQQGSKHDLLRLDLAP